jgi:hypothetical protein
VFNPEGTQLNLEEARQKAYDVEEPTATINRDKGDLKG